MTSLAVLRYDPGHRKRWFKNPIHLKEIANLTRGQYFYAGTATDLKKVYESMNSKLLLETKEMEISSLFAAAAALALVSALLSLLWFQRIL